MRLLLIAPLLLFAESVREKFVALDEKKDHAALVALWKEHPHDALAAIDEDLEGALALIEKSGDAAKVKAMHERALRGAKAADEAFGRPIFGDYVSSYVGWNAEQQKTFRQGQKASGAAGAALRKKDFAEAKSQAQLCIDFARPLGDWWGASSGYAALGAAEAGLGHKEAALDAYQQARLLHHDMSFARNELRDLQAMAPLLLELGRKARAEFAIDQGLALAKELGDEKATAALEALKKK